MKALLLLLLPALLFPKELVYEVYLFFFPVGEVKIELSEGRALAEGKTKEGWRWLYSYDFKFVQEGDEVLLVEVEKGKKKTYEGKKVYEKKPWIPVVVEYLRTGTVKETDFFKVKRENGTLRVIPLKSKKVKEIVLEGGNPPKEIKIEGKADITLKLKYERED